jgi:hypothetical protein
VFAKILKNSAFWFVFLGVVFFLVRVPGVGTDISNSDALRWHRRSINFISAIKSRNFLETYQRYHPGVTLMWIDGLTLNILEKTSYFKEIGDSQQDFFVMNPKYYPVFHSAVKVVLLLILTLLFTSQLFLIKESFNTKTALLFGLFLIFEPYIIGINRWVHLTSLEAFLTFTAVLSALQVYKHYKYFWITAFCLSTALLTKTSTLIVIPIILLIIVAKSKDNLTRAFIRICELGITSSVIFVALFPAMWVNPIYVLEQLGVSIFSSAFENMRGEVLTGNMRFAFYPLVLLYKYSPVFLIGLLVGPLSWIKNKYFRFNEVIVVIYFIVTLIFLTSGNQKIDRYTISLIMPLLLLSAIGLSKFKIYFQLPAVFIQLAFFIYAYATFFPVYSAFYNPVLGGTKKALLLGIYDNSGEYLAQAANYVNSQGLGLVVYTPENIEAVSPFIRGKVISSLGDFQKKPSFEIYTLDIDRKNELGFGKTCSPQPEKTFGSDYPVVFVYKCF